MPELEARKAALLSIRESRAPINRNEIEDHEKYYRGHRQEMESKMQEKKPPPRYDANFTVTKTSEKFRLLEEQRLREERLKEQEAKEHIMRQRNYGNLVREMYAPTVDPAKQREVAQRLKRQEPRPRPEYHDPYHGHPPPLPEGYVPAPKPRKESPKPVKKIDYLQEIKHKREQEQV